MHLFCSQFSNWGIAIATSSSAAGSAVPEVDPLHELQALASAAEDFGTSEPPVPAPALPPPDDQPQPILCAECGKAIVDDNKSCLPSYCQPCFQINVAKSREAAKGSRDIEEPSSGWLKQHRESEQVWFARVEARSFCKSGHAWVHVFFFVPPALGMCSCSFSRSSPFCLFFWQMC